MFEAFTTITVFFNAIFLAWVNFKTNENTRDLNEQKRDIRHLSTTSEFQGMSIHGLKKDLKEAAETSALTPRIKRLEESEKKLQKSAKELVSFIGGKS